MFENASNKSQSADETRAIVRPVKWVRRLYGTNHRSIKADFSATFTGQFRRGKETLQERGILRITSQDKLVAKILSIFRILKRFQWHVYEPI